MQTSKNNNIKLIPYCTSLNQIFFNILLAEKPRAINDFANSFNAFTTPKKRKKNSRFLVQNNNCKQRLI
jgi:hypothetical protein